MTLPTSGILLVNDTAFVDGGASHVAILEALGLAKAGKNVTFFAASGPPDERLAAVGVNVVLTGQSDIAHDPSRLRAASQGLWNLTAAKKFSALLVGFDSRSSIVHVHSWTKALSSSVVHAACNAGFPVVVTVHDYFLACPTGGFFNHQTQNLCRLSPLSLECLMTNCDPRRFAHKAWRSARQLIQIRAGRMPASIAGFIHVSGFSEGIMAPFLPSRTTRTFPNPVVAIQEAPAEVERYSRVVMVGRLAPEKGPHLLLHAAAQAKVPVSFLGDGSMRDDLQRIDPGVHISGWLPSADVALELRQARALVLPSLLYETQGLVVSEAAALGVPSVVPTGTAAASIVEHGVTGLHFKRGDVDDLAKALSQLSNDALAAKLGKAAFERYWANAPTLERHVEDVVSFYEEVIAASKTRNAY